MTGGFRFLVLFATEAEHLFLSLSDGDRQSLWWLLTK
jgi:hypothetical protein